MANAIPVNSESAELAKLVESGKAAKAKRDPKDPVMPEPKVDVSVQPGTKRTDN